MSKQFACNIIRKKRFQVFHWWIEQIVSLYNTKLTEYFAISIILVKLRFQCHDSEPGRSNAMSDDFSG